MHTPGKETVKRDEFVVGACEEVCLVLFRFLRERGKKRETETDRQGDKESDTLGDRETDG